jgi:hypothetical protein
MSPERFVKGESERTSDLRRNRFLLFSVRDLSHLGYVPKVPVGAIGAV